MKLTQGKKRLVLLVILVAIEIFMTVTSTGYIVVGGISITLLHVPVCLAAILLGLPAGLLLGGLFGLSSMISAIAFAADGTLDALFRNPLLSVAPRLLIPVVVWLVHRAVSRSIDDNTLSAKLIGGAFASTCGVITNLVGATVAVLLVYPDALGVSTSLEVASIVISNLIAWNIVVEVLVAIAATWVAVAVCERLHISSGPAAEGTRQKPIRKTFRKWLFLFIVGTFLLMLAFLFALLSSQDENSARTIMVEKARDIARQIERSGDDFSREELTIGASGAVLLARDGVIFNTPYGMMDNVSLADMGADLDAIAPEQVFDVGTGGLAGICVYTRAGDDVVVAYLPDSEIYAGRNQSAALLLSGLLVMFIALYIGVSALVQRNVVNKVQDVNASLLQIQGGNLDEKVAVGGNTEFEELSAGINATVDALKGYIAREAARIDEELAYAKRIQESALPRPAGALRNNRAFKLGAFMDTAKEVGGDFYDFYMLDLNTLVFLLAEVSGKGIPAAMFMMTGKSTLRDSVGRFDDVGEMMSYANDRLCEGNDAGMFITAWMGVLDLTTGAVRFANAGHNPPVLVRDGRAEYLKMEVDLVLAMMDDEEYMSQTLALKPGDVLFLYTDGVTEATNAASELYGEARLLEVLSGPMPEAEDVCDEVCRRVKASLDDFVLDAPQADDITMVCLRYDGKALQT